jgi:pimeloyl-ACP methyl ester carboxylesterase
MTTLFHFGDSAAPLVGVYHAPMIRGSSTPAVLLCNPFGEEAIRAFRIFRLIAQRAAEAGAPAMRFDYFATGDSSGECGDARLAGFASGVLDAHQELLDMSGAARAIWVGLRLGAAAAALAASERPQGLAGLALWDPVVSGAAYLDELRAGHGAAIAAQIGRPPADHRGEALGFEVSSGLQQELEGLNLLALKKTARRVAVIAGRDPPTDPALKEALVSAGAEVEWIEDPGEATWNSDRALNAFVVPAKTIDLLLERIGRWR